MASSRDDFIIAIRSAFLKKSTQQKFSIIILVFTSIFIIVWKIRKNNWTSEFFNFDTKIDFMARICSEMGLYGSDLAQN